MISKAKIKLLQSLRQNKYRKQHPGVLAEGSINVCDFLKGSLTVKEVYGTGAWVEKHRELLKSVPVEEVSPSELEKISALKNPSEVVAVVEKPEYKLPALNQVQH